MIYSLDIGGTKIEFASFDRQLNRIESFRIDTPTEDYGEFIQALVELVQRADRQYQTRGSVGIGMPGLIDRRGRSLSANVPCATGNNIAETLRERLKRPIAIENDCRLFALSEANGGAGEGFRHVYGAVLGTGAAGGLTIDRRLYRSRQGIAGEYGHNQLPAHLQQKYQLPLRTCGCGLPNCFEGYISGPGLSALHRHFCQHSLSVPELVQQWRSGDPQATKTMLAFFDLLGASFATLVMAYDPDIIVVGGGLSQIGELYQYLPGAIEQHLFVNFTAPPIEPAKYGDASGARGAAILVKQQSEQTELLSPG